MNPIRQSFLRKKRVPLFWFFIVLAIPLSVLLVAFAKGYRVDTSTGQVIETSALAIESTPKTVTVRINDVLEDKTTPFIKIITPGEYRIQLEKDGYQSWQKRITFESGRSVIFPRVILFLKSDAVARATVPEDPIAESSSLEPLTAQELQLYSSMNWEGADSLRVIRGPKDILVDQQKSVSYILDDIASFAADHRVDMIITDGEWNADGVLLYSTEFELWSFDPNTNESTLLNRQSKPISDVAWHAEGDYLFFSDESGITAMEIDPREHRQLWQLTTLPYATHLRLNSKGNVLTFIANRQWYDLALY